MVVVGWFDQVVAYLLKCKQIPYWVVSYDVHVLPEVVCLECGVVRRR